MSDNLKIAMLPAKEGDCLVIAYGENSRQKYILIDTGRAWTYENALKNYLLANDILKIELLIITHVDRDHIDGMLKLVTDPALNLQVNHIWFNTYDHLRGNKIEKQLTEDDMEGLGAEMGEILSAQIIAKGWPWNRHFDGKAVALNEDMSNNIKQFGDIRLTLLSPDTEKFDCLIPKWEKECRDAGIAPGSEVKDYVVPDDDLEDFGTIDIEALAEEEYPDDHSPANGSSIAFIFHYKNRKMLLAGDAHPDLLIKSLKGLGVSEKNPIKLDAFKIPHHGSKYNISKPLLDMMTCDHYLISTNGNYFKHPDQAAMAKLIKYGTTDSTILFNYKTDQTKLWENATWQQKYKYKTNYPGDGQDGYISLKLGISQ